MNTVSVIPLQFRPLGCTLPQLQSQLPRTPPRSQSPPGGRAPRGEGIQACAGYCTVWRRNKQHRGRTDLHHQPTQLDLPDWTPPLYLSGEAGENNIGAAGCRYLSQAKMGGLEIIDLSPFFEKVGTNKMEDTACKFLSRANWKKLQKILVRTVSSR